LNAAFVFLYFFFFTKNFTFFKLFLLILSEISNIFVSLRSTAKKGRGVSLRKGTLFGKQLKTVL